MRAGTEYFLRTVMQISEVFDGDLTRAVVFLTINAANTGYMLDDPELDRRFAEAEIYVPEEARRPITRTAVSNAARIPFETARRHCNALVADGWCKDLGPRGLVVNIERASHPAVLRMREANEASLRRLLQRIGYEPPAE